MEVWLGGILVVFMMTWMELTTKTWIRTSLSSGGNTPISTADKKFIGCT